jgi:Suppressor of fused protein (SUFU)
MALAFVEDPVLRAFDTPLGRVEFITVVGITSDELEPMKASSTDAVVDELRQRSPKLVTDPSRTN